MLWSLLRQSCNKFVVLQRPILCLLIFIRTHLFWTVRVKAIVEIFKNIKFNDVMENFLGMGLYLYRTNHFFLLSASTNILGCVFCVQGKVSYSWDLHSTAVLAENGKLSQLPQIISTDTTSVGSSRKSFSSGNCSSCKNSSPTLDPVLVIILQRNQSGTLLFIQPIRV